MIPGDAPLAAFDVPLIGPAARFGAACLDPVGADAAPIAAPRCFSPQGRRRPGDAHSLAVAERRFSPPASFSCPAAVRFNAADRP